MNEEIKPENMRIHSRADELIACLEGEIAKRDARIVELKRYDEAVERAAFEAWHKDRYPAVKIRVQNLLGTYTNMQVECNFETWLACAESHSKRFGGALLDANARLNGPPVSEAKAQGVVMPERDAVIRKAVGMCNRIPGSTTWNAAEFAYDELADRINATPVQQVSVQGGLELIKWMQVCLSLDDTEWGLSAPEKYKLLGDIKSYVLAAPAAPAADAGVTTHE